MVKFSTGLLIFFVSILLQACSPLTGVDTSKYDEDYVHNPDEITCKRVIKTGTRMTSEMCKTNTQWAQQSRDASEATTAIQREATQGSSPPSG
jgi:hypothetical protein